MDASLTYTCIQIRLRTWTMLEEYLGCTTHIKRFLIELQYCTNKYNQTLPTAADLHMRYTAIRYQQERNGLVPVPSMVSDVAPGHPVDGKCLRTSSGSLSICAPCKYDCSNALVCLCSFLSVAHRWQFHTKSADKFNQWNPCSTRSGVHFILCCPE